MTRRLLLTLLLLAPLALAGDLEDALARIAEKGKSVQNFRALFRQTKSVYLLDEPLRSEGRILYRPGRLRWETTAPEASVLVIDEAGMKVYLPKLRQLEVYDFPGREALGAILPLFGQSVEDLRRSYEVSLKTGDPALFVLDLVPKSERMRRAVARLEVAIDRASLLPNRLVTEDPSGDKSETTFEHVEPNVDISESDFELKVPPGTAVKKPLGGLPF
jgi:outer membrane lipoprotein-sorting protein